MGPAARSMCASLSYESHSQYVLPACRFTQVCLGDRFTVMGAEAMCRSAYAVWQLWPVYVARCAVRDLYRGMPGPRWVKVLLIVFCQLIPGGFDEIALIAVTKAYRTWQARRRAANVSV